ncbi:hypothetical protein [Bacillus sp. KH172YL63]|uniref:hypothetical protein n=1 Tax=Bacillus sp. KH172YL63 TaxID=2709784 RepID=UPI0013E501A9|nr:hypothetical protein [Bacillus sp. KH172YL63]BCB05581.1 hypothetical protein KH172YL63_37140 [Bacillus sp. KH172YL63]
MMYLSTTKCFELDKVIKSFEVAYRSLVVDKLKKKFINETEFYSGITLLQSQISKSSLVHSNKFNQKIKEIRQNQKDIYNAIEYSYNCYCNKDYDIDENQKDVLYLGQIIDFTLFYFSTDFIILSKEFKNIEQFVYYSINYQKIRNSLSHPASSKVTYEDAKEIITFIRKMIEKLDEKYFWFVSKGQIVEKINNLLLDNKNNPIKTHNLSEITLDHKKLLFRDNELQSLRDLIVGHESYYRKAGSVVVYGYGGVGKTALIIEFLKEIIKDTIDKNIGEPYDFMLFFTSKEELLKISTTTGNLYISDIRKQINSFEELNRNIYKYLGIKNWEESFQKQYNKGLIIIDNFETFDEEDKIKTLDFIKKSPRSVQYIITSRNEERCEEKLYIEGFNEKNNGVNFINDYINENNLSLNLSNESKLELLHGTKGNTLILVLALERLNEGKTSINTIVSELEDVSSQNAEIIADFMYKNSFNQTIDELTSKGYEPIKMLRIISLYNEPVDIFSISKISNINIKDIEHMCNYLSTKLILNKTEELYSLNEFANKFIFIKFMPNRIELINLEDKIYNHKKSIKRNLSNLEGIKAKNALLNKIMDDWKPKNYIDEIAISEVFNLYGQALDSLGRYKGEELKEKVKDMELKFKEFEIRTSHPYVKCQKARIFKLFLDSGVETEHSTKVVNDYFEQTIYSVQFNYNYIRNTKSYAAILWIYGIFLSKNLQDKPNAIKYLEESKSIFEALNILDANYYKMLAELCRCYNSMFKKTNNNDYFQSLLLIEDQINQNPQFVRGFKISFLKRDLKRYIGYGKKTVISKS